MFRRTLEGQVAIVTGAGTGIGHGIALALAEERVKVVLCGRRAKPIQEALQEIQERGGEGMAVQADVSQEKDVDRLVRTTLETYGTIDILVNNAGIGGGARIHEHGIQDWDRVMAVNLRGPFLTCRAVLPVMRARRSGHILNISSESGLNHYEGDGAYGISKHALNDLGETIQRENQDLNIRVNTICPGMVVSEMTENSPGLEHAKCLLPEDIADLALWLLQRRLNVKIGMPILIQTMENPWK